MSSNAIPTTGSSSDAFTVSFLDGNSTSSITTTLVPSMVDDVQTRPEYFEAIGYAGLMIAAMVANIFAISTILRTKTLRNNDHNLLIVNLNIMDLGITLLSMSFSVGSFFDGGAYLKHNYALCRFHGFFAMTFTVGNFTNTLCIAVDRYLTVVWSTRFPPSRRRILILLAYSWIVAIIFASMPTFEVASHFVYTYATHHCSPSWSSCGYYIAWFVHIYGITVPIMIFCYFFVFRVIRQKEQRLRQYDLKSSSSGAAIKNSSSAGSLGRDEEKKITEFPSASIDSTPDSVPDVETARSFGVQVVYAQHALSASQSELYSNSDADDREVSAAAAATDMKGATTSDHARALTDGDWKHRQFRQSPRTDVVVRWSSGTDLDTEDEGLSDGKIVSSSDGWAKKREKTTKKQRRRKVKLQKLSVDKQVALTGVMLVLTTVICWTPYNMIHSCFFNIDLSHPLDALTMWVGYLNALLDPLIYTFMNRKARAAGSERTRRIRDALGRMRDWCWGGQRA